MKKRILACLIVTFMLAALFTACAPQSGTSPTPVSTPDGNNTADPTPDNNQPSNAKVTLASFPDQPKSAFEACIAAANLGFDVEIIEYPQNEYESKIKLAFSSTPTDLILMDGPNIASYASSDVLEPLDAYWDSADFDDLVAASQSANTWNGQIWSAPLNESNTILYYNKRVFAELGIEVPTKVEDAWSWERLLEVCELVTKKDASGKTERYAILPQMFSHANKNEGQTYTEMLWVWQAGGDFISPDGKTASGVFDSAASKKGLQYYADLYTKGYAYTEDIMNAFETEKVAMWINGPWMIGTWKNDFPEFYDGGWGAMPLPKDVKGASGSGSWAIAIAQKSQNKDNAWKVVEAITGKEGSKIWCEETGNLSARKSVLESLPMYKEYPFDIINQQLVANATARPVTPAYPEISQAVMDCFNELAFGADVDSAVSKAVNLMNDALSAVQ